MLARKKIGEDEYPEVTSVSSILLIISYLEFQSKDELQPDKLHSSIADFT